MFEASVIVSYYNNIHALTCIIKALENQQENFEVIIADDGSRQEIVEQVNALIDKSSLSIKHIWQKDNGFRKTRILNKAVKQATSPYFIFIDGDCIPQKHFVYDHLANKAHGVILNGRRVDMAAEYKVNLYNSAKPECFFSQHSLGILVKYLFGKGKNIEKGIRITNESILKFLNRKPKGIVGCNFSLHKEDFIAVNGFDNRYDVPCVGEDTDIEYRLVNTGKQIKNVFHQAVVLHILHPELPRLERATQLFEETQTNQQFIALDGYHQAQDVD
ncbi:glycosyltransferase [Vibrio pacinii]|uniref:glycosyltransferase n=1 Tax=Vibrio pacinii TaxID=170674 RepID=UPI00056E0E9E|nr:glycosyltransferase [Vibrio pacinii]